MLHESLVELSREATACRTHSHARGILSEAHHLLRNALDHSGDPTLLMSWYCDVVRNVFHSPATALPRINGRAVLPSAVELGGDFSRGEGLPTSPIVLVLPTNTPHPSTLRTQALEQDPAALTAHDPGLASIPATDRLARIEGYLQEIHSLARSINADGAHHGRSQTVSFVTRPSLADANHAGNGSQRALYADSPTNQPIDPALEHLLLVDASAARPRAVTFVGGMPDKDATADVRRDVINPCVALARWAAVRAATASGYTPDRLHSPALSVDESEYVLDAWRTGIKIDLEQWKNRSHADFIDDLSHIHRSAYGASARMISEVIASVVTRSEEAPHGR